MGLSCLAITPRIQSIIDKIQKLHPQFTSKDAEAIIAGAIDEYNNPNITEREVIRYIDNRNLSNSKGPFSTKEYNVEAPFKTNNSIVYSRKEDEEQQVIKGQLGVNKKQLISLLGSTMYQQGRQGVAIKELLQNAFDAVKIAESQGKISKGKINITLDKSNRTVKVSDNGTGMTPEIVQKAFFTIGGSYKGESIDNRLKSGGLGLAKMAFLFGSDYVEVSTVKDGIKTYVRATPEEIENDNFNIITSGTSEPNGTTVEVKIPEYYLDNNGEKRTIWFESSPAFLAQPMLGNVDLTITKKGFMGGSSITKTEDKSLIPEGYISIGRATSAFGDIDIMIAPKSSNYTSVSPKVLISGLHQFNDWINLENSKARFDIILNILPKVGVQDELYPINNQREGFRATVKPEVEDIHFLIKKINNILERMSVASAFGKTISMTAAKVSDVKREVPLTLQDTATEIKKEIFKVDSPSVKSFTGDDILKVLSLSSVREEREKQRRSSFDSSGININGDNSKLVVDTSSLDLKKPVFHNNTTMQIEEDGQKVITAIGELLLELKSLYMQTYKDAKILTGYEKGRINVVEYIANQYWGISFDKGYGGVNVNPALMPLLAINPFYQVSEYPGVDSALVLTEYITHLIIHEFNHNYASGEGAEFTGRFPTTYGEFAGIGTQFTKDWKNKLYILIRDNLQTFKKYAKRYEQSENIGESFDGEQITERPSSKEEGPSTDGSNIQGDRSRENVQGNGGEFDVISEQIQRFQKKQQPVTITYTPIGKETQTYEELDVTSTITPQQLQQTQKEKGAAPKPISQVELPNVNRTRLNEEVNRTFGNSRIKDDRVRAIATTFSDVVDLLIEEAKENGEEVKNRQKFIISHLKDILGYTYVDDNGQQQVVEGLLQDAFNPDNADDEEVAEAMSKFSYTTNPNVWMALLEQAAPMIQQYEGIIINMHNKSIEQNQANREEDWEANGEDILSLKDGWMIKARELDLRDTLSQKTRRLLARIKEALGYDENGEPKVQYDDLGFVRYLNPDYAHLKLLGVLSKATDSNDFDRLLEEMAKKESWITFLLDEFKADPSIKATFYGDLRKEFIPYWIHFNSNDGALTKQLNFEPSILYYMKEWEHNYNGHIQLSDNSVFNNDGSANNQHIEEALNKYTELKDKYLNGFENFEDYSALKGLFDDLGISYTEEELEYAITTSEEPTETINTVLGGIRTILTKLQNEGVKSSPVRQFKSAFMDIANALNLIPQGATMAAFMENGKNYQSYANPSWIGTWINSIHSDAGVEYLAKEYGQYKHFYKDGRWRGPWLQLMMGKDGKKYRDLLDRKVVLKSEDKEYTDWTDKEYFNVIFREFLATNNKDTAYYYLPILADAPSSEFIRFKRYSDKDYKDTILEGLYEVFLQEVDRIQLVQSRKNTDGVYPIQNLDKFGGQFNFFPSLNNKEFLDEYNSLLAKDNKNTQEGNPTSYSKTFAIKAIQAEMENGFAEFTKDVVKYGYKANDPTIENYYWNNALAYTQIVTLTTTDLAYYKGLSDFQKRYKEVYSMTRRLYENATYPDGSLVGTTEQSALQRDENGVYEWVITLKDINVPATIIEEASAAVRRRIGPDLTKVEADYIISQMKNVNAADAQAFRSLDSYRDVLTMSGDWTTEMETAYQHLNSPNAQDWTVEDFNVLWLTIKPFLFGMKSVDSQVTLSDNTPYGNLRVPIQFKNSEALLLSLYSKIAEKETESPLLVALGKVMRGDLTPGRKISSIQFESAEKAGGQAAISLKDVNLNSEEDILNTFRETLNADKGNFVAKKIYMKDYGIQVTSPEHLYDHYGLIQSQFKKHITANLPDNFSINVQGKSFDRLGVYNLMQQILTENIIESFEECEKIFGSKEAVEAELQKSMAGNTRYTEEDRRACTLFTDSEGNKQWSTLLFDPIQSQRIQNLLMAIIKSKVVKQEARRSYLVQATGVGFTDDLHVRFYDTEGHFIFNEREFNGTEPCRPKFQNQLDKVRNQHSSFQDYISSVKKDSNAIAYHEIAMPPYSRDIIAACQDENGELDISKLPDELREGITLRSPNEAKYSTQPVYIKFFLPRNNGGIIMHPIEITEFVGADFDYDKMMAYFHEFRVIDKKRDEYNDLSIRAKEMWEGNDDVLIDFLANLDLEIAPEFQNTSLQQLITELGATEARQAVGYKAWLSYQKDMNPDNYSRLMKLPVRVEKIKYDINKPVKELSKAQRNNLYFDTAFKVLTNPTVVEQMVSPGNFDELKRLSKIKKVIRDVPIEDIRKEIDAVGMSLEDTLEKLYTIKEEKAKEILAKYAKPLDPKSVNTQLYFHRQNANAGKMIGIYAVASSAHSLFQYTSTGFKTPINIMGTTIKTVDPVKDRNGKWVSKNMEQFTAASVDDVKDPTLSDLNQNTFTGDLTNAMIRMGFPISVATNVVMAKDYAVVREDEELNTQITEKELITLIYYQSKDNLTPNQHSEVLTGKATYDSTLSLEERTKMNDLMKKFRVTNKVISKAATEISKITLASRSDSPNNSAGPTIGDALMRFVKLLNLFESLGKKTFNIYTNAFDKEALLGDAALGQRDDIIDYVFSEEAYDTGKVRDNAYNNAIPFIEAATKLGVLGPLKLLRNYFPQLNAANVKLLLNKESGLLSYLNSGGQSEENGVKLINRFFNDYYIYALNNTDFFGKTTDVSGALSKSKLYNSSYYMLTFPEHLMDWFNNQKNKETINNNALLRNLEFPIKNGVRMVVFSNAKDLSKEEKAKVSDAWTDLVCSDDISLQSIGYQLFKYGSFMGLNYTGPQSFIHLAPAVVRESIEDYYRGLTALEKNDFNYGLPFIEQFIRNNYTMRGFLPQIKSSNIADFNEDSLERITVKDVARVTIDTIETYTEDGNIVEDPVLAKVVVLAYRDKSQNTINRLYKQDNVIKDAQGRVIGVAYSELTPLGINGFKEYYQGVAEPSSVLDHYSKRDYLLKDTPKSSEVPSDEINAGDEVINPDDFMPEEEASYREIEDALSSNSEPITITPADPVDPDTKEPICGTDLAGVLDSF